MNYKTQNKSYTIEEYNPSWVASFETISKNIKDIFKDKALFIEHVGSTAVTGMKAKPIIDVLVIVEIMETFEQEKQEMKRFGYEWKENYLADNSLFFSKDVDGNRLENIHVFPQGHARIAEFLDVRDYLRSHPDRAREYEELKLTLFKKFPNDYISYRTNKDAFLQKLLSDAEAWRKTNA